MRPHLGAVRIRDLSPDLLLAWQRKLTKEGATKRHKDEDGTLLPPRGLSPNTIRLARSPLSGAIKLAMSLGMISTNPLTQVPPPACSAPRRAQVKNGCSGALAAFCTWMIKRG